MRYLNVLLLFFLAACSSGGGDFDYTALGASDAVGIGATPLTNGYVYRIERQLEADRGDGVDLENLGIPGAEVDGIKDREVPLAKRRTAELITIFAGANDLTASKSVEDFELDLGDILRELRDDQPGALIAVANIPDLTKVPRYDDGADPDVTIPRIQSYNAAIARQANAVGALIVDLFSIPFSDNEVAEDGFHPSDAGHALIAQAFISAIEPHLPPPGESGSSGE